MTVRDYKHVAALAFARLETRIVVLFPDLGDQCVQSFNNVFGGSDS
jgi:hypothetical protein